MNDPRESTLPAAIQDLSPSEAADAFAADVLHGLQRLAMLFGGYTFGREKVDLVHYLPTFFWRLSCSRFAELKLFPPAVDVNQPYRRAWETAGITVSGRHAFLNGGFV